jgi:hypothetical protein
LVIPATAAASIFLLVLIIIIIIAIIVIVLIIIFFIFIGKKGLDAKNSINGNTLGESIILQEENLQVQELEDIEVPIVKKEFKKNDTLGNFILQYMIEN